MFTGPGDLVRVTIKRGDQGPQPGHDIGDRAASGSGNRPHVVVNALTQSAVAQPRAGVCRGEVPCPRPRSGRRSFKPASARSQRGNVGGRLGVPYQLVNDIARCHCDSPSPRVPANGFAHMSAVRSHSPAASTRMMCSRITASTAPSASRTIRPASANRGRSTSAAGSIPNAMPASASAAPGRW